MGEIHRDQYVSTVQANVPLCSEHFRLVLQLPEFPPTEPGQFIQISCRDLDVEYGPEHEMVEQDGHRSKPIGVELQAPLAMLRRPFSLAGRRDVGGDDLASRQRAEALRKLREFVKDDLEERRVRLASAGRDVKSASELTEPLQTPKQIVSADRVELDIIHRVVGVGTDWMSRLKVGDCVHILGPLGNRFTLPEHEQKAILVGGGVGIPPMLYLAERLAGRSAVAFCGALRRDLLPLTIRERVRAIGDADPREDIVEFARHGVASVITTDDGSYGFRGFVTQALEQYLDSRETGAAKPIIYTCGPEPMMKRVADIANARGIECQIAVERAMACGMGTCQSCCIKVRRPPAAASSGRDWVYRLACTDGPVFRGAELLW
ncbi:MAG TPA: dihydroorotate dehydrogenase electron transfer subunit [Tepidisphaeraceae bacterium]|nr:dihydroorotate dehydrogenase electron transfer subunit [Tepidisphaeraceae bacterium]